MFKLRTGYFISGITTGLILLFSFIFSLPDGKLHIHVCDVGQGDAIYVRFPDGKDMVIDGGPNDAIIGCLGKYMPFWDRHIDVVAMTHPQKDHMQGLIAVLKRYKVAYFLRSDVRNSSQGFIDLLDVIRDKRVAVRYITRGEQIRIGKVVISLLWPSDQQVSKGANVQDVYSKGGSQVLGQTTGDLNDYSLVFWLRFGAFDALFTGDADTHVEDNYVGTTLADRTVELLKVPHHGSRTGMNDAFVQWLRPRVAVISVGKNMYGHPSREAISLLQSVGSQIHRTDNEGDIEVVSDGNTWKIE